LIIPFLELGFLHDKYFRGRKWLRKKLYSCKIFIFMIILNHKSFFKNV